MPASLPSITSTLALPEILSASRSLTVVPASYALIFSALARRVTPAQRPGLFSRFRSERRPSRPTRIRRDRSRRQTRGARRGNRGSQDRRLGARVEPDLGGLVARERLLPDGGPTEIGGASAQRRHKPRSITRPKNRHDIRNAVHSLALSAHTTRPQPESLRVARRNPVLSSREICRHACRC